MLVSAIIGAVMFDYRLDESFFTYRIARNVAEGVGFSYNAWEPVLGVSNPLYVLLMAIGALFASDLPALGAILGGALIGLCGAAMVALARPSGRVCAWGAGLFTVGFPLVWLTLGMEPPLALLFGLLAVWCYEREKLNLTGLVLGLGVLTQPNVLILAFVLAVHHTLTERKLPPSAAAGVFLATLTPWLLFATTYYGSPLPTSLIGMDERAALTATDFATGVRFAEGIGLLGLALVEQAWLWVAVGVIALYGLIVVYRERWALLLLAWAAWHVVFHLVMATDPNRQFYVPLTPGLAALFGLGVRWLAGHLHEWKKWIAIGLAVAFLAGASGWSLYLIDATPRHDAAFRAGHGAEMLPTVDWDSSRETGEWLRENTPPEARVAAGALWQVGYWSGRPIIDYHGVFQPDMARALARRDIYWFLPHTMPEYLVLSEADGILLGDHSLADDVWFHVNYVETERFEDERYTGSPLVIYERVGAPRPMTEATFGVHTFSEGLSLNRMMTDFPIRPLVEGQAVRVGLEWYLDGSVLEPQHVAVRIRSYDGQILAGQSYRSLDLSTWPQRRLITTYHTFQIAPILPTGAYDVDVGVGSAPDTLNWQTIVQASVPLAEETYIGALSGAREELGDVALIGYRLARIDESLDVILVWEAIDSPAEEYVVFIQVSDSEDNVVVQVNAEPRGGSYPTTVWRMGETVSDTYTLDITALEPGDYEVHVGLMTQDDERLRTPDGADSILIGRISIAETED